ncbi:hypothetical protein [uncultured Thiodictyon sp.]|uniref:hypothetical protein n=1 Tax=uncultured Thiodictyon sp. TaxID=1846217 RepID=UPI0025CCB7E3|nr:hypothetical protein [uncultured Thiodictyon sp.]
MPREVFVTEDATRDLYQIFVILFDRRAGQPPMAERTASEEVRSPRGGASS